MLLAGALAPQIALLTGCTTAGRNIASRGAWLAANTNSKAVEPTAAAPPAAQDVQRCGLTEIDAGLNRKDFESRRVEVAQAAVALEGPRIALMDDLPATAQPAGETLPQSGHAEVPVELGAVLEMAAGQNPQVAFARQRILEAAAQLQAADVLWLPSLRAGVNYNKHEGRLQDVEGVVQEISRGSLYSGFGAQAVGAGSPAVPGLLMSFHTRDALFQPRIAESNLAARQQASRAVMQDLLTETAIAYINLLEAMQNRSIGREVTANFQDLADLTASFASSGAGLQADADRVRTELFLSQLEITRFDENVQVAAARLAQLLSQDPTISFAPVESSLAPMDIIAPNQPLSELVATGLTNRPELAENRSLVTAAVERLRRERYAPLVPSVLLGVSYGWNGGGVGGNLENFGDRADVDAVAWWEIRNLGFGEQAARDLAQSQVAQARTQQVRIMDLVASEIAQSHSLLVARRGQIALAQQGIASADESFRRNSERIRNAQGLPIESLQSVQALGQARRQYARAVADYNRAQFLLQRALGWPVGSETAER
jgi:outer membrane protein TolC